MGTTLAGITLIKDGKLSDYKADTGLKSLYRTNDIILTEKKDSTDYIEHLFRNDSGKLVSTLTRLFGTENIELAEDVVQEAYGDAIIHWKSDGIPDNPYGWIYKVAKNKA